MVRRYRRWLLLGTMAALICALAVVVGVGFPAGTAASLADHAFAVVLVPGAGRSELVVVDLDSVRVVRRVALRSLVTDIDADAVNRRVVGAQTGGVGDAADDSVSIVDPVTGAVCYVTLPRNDPSQVECLDGRAMVLHSWVDASGFVVSSVDVASAVATATGHAPDGTGLWAAAGGSLWTSVLSNDHGPGSLVRLDPMTLSPTSVDCGGIDPAAVIAAGDRVAVLGSLRGTSDGVGQVTLLDPQRGTVSATGTVPGLPHGPQAAAVAGAMLIVGDWIGEAPESDVLSVLDLRTLEPLVRIHVGSAPCALGGYQDQVLVVDRVDGVLRDVDPRTGSVKWAVDLGVRDLVCSKVLVFGRGSGAARP